MKAILVNDDRSLRWDNVPDSILGEDDCLIKIEAAAVMPNTQTLSTICLCPYPKTALWQKRRQCPKHSPRRI